MPDTPEQVGWPPFLGVPASPSGFRPSDRTGYAVSPLRASIPNVFKQFTERHQSEIWLPPMLSVPAKGELP